MTTTDEAVALVDAFQKALEQGTTSRFPLSKVLEARLAARTALLSAVQKLREERDEARRQLANCRKGHEELHRAVASFLGDA